MASTNYHSDVHWVDSDSIIIIYDDFIALSEVTVADRADEMCKV